MVLGEANSVPWFMEFDTNWHGKQLKNQLPVNVQIMANQLPRQQKQVLLLLQLPAAILLSQIRTKLTVRFHCPIIFSACLVDSAHFNSHFIFTCFLVWCWYSILTLYSCIYLDWCIHIHTNLPLGELVLGNKF